MGGEEGDLRFETERPVDGGLWKTTAGAAPFGGGRALLVLKPGCLVSTRTLFLHREERVETGGYEFNRQDAGGDSGERWRIIGEVAV
jgi:hypothetical protein